MPVSSSLEERKNTMPTSMSVAVIMERRESTNIWADEVWTAIGVTGDTQSDTTEKAGGRVINEHAGMQQVLYYHNIVLPDPGVYVITRDNDDGVPVPYIVTPSFDEANAYLECEGEAFTVPMPPELYIWMEEFVLQNYMPEKRVKRKRKDWRKEGHEGPGFKL